MPVRLIIAIITLFTVVGNSAFAGNSITVRVHPKGMFLKAHKKDKRQSPARILLRKISAKTGQRITLIPTGDYKSGGRFKDNSTGMIGVFIGLGRKSFLSPASGSEVLAADTKTCWEDNIRSNDIPHDFVVGSGKLIVPKGARAILFSAFDCHFVDNSDPDRDFFVKAIKVN